MSEFAKSLLQKPNLSNIKFIICDFDGTLVDSMASLNEAFAGSMQQDFNIDPQKAKEYYLSTAGASFASQIKGAAKKFARKEITDTTGFEEQFAKYQRSAGPPKVIEGSRETLKLLKEKGLKITVWSGTRTEVLGVKLEQTALNHFVDFYIGNVPGSEILVKGPGLFAQIARHFQVQIKKLQKESLVVGDGEADMIAGKNSYTRTVGVVGLKSKKDLEKAGADFIIDKISDLPALMSC